MSSYSEEKLQITHMKVNKILNEICNKNKVILGGFLKNDWEGV